MSPLRSSFCSSNGKCKEAGDDGDDETENEEEKHSKSVCRVRVLVSVEWHLQMNGNGRLCRLNYHILSAHICTCIVVAVVRLLQWHLVPSRAVCDKQLSQKSMCRSELIAVTGGYVLRIYM